MAHYKYQAITAQGKATSGNIEAESITAVSETLRDNDLIPWEIVSVSKLPATLAEFFGNHLQAKVSSQQLALSTRLLSTMLGAGISLEQSLNFVAQRSPRAVNAAYNAIRSSVMEGEPLARAMSDYPEIFDRRYLASITAGEQAGALDTVMENLADLHESQCVRAQQFSAALIYPIILFVTAVAIVIILMVNVMPGFIEIFEQNQQPLPTLTVLLISVFETGKDYGQWILLGVLIITGILTRITKSKKFAVAYHQLQLRLPLVRTFILNRAGQQLASTLHILTSSGVQLLDALKICEGVLSNSTLMRQLQCTTNQVEQGSSFATALAKNTVFPPLLIQLVESGEASGKLDETLMKASKLLEAQTRASIEKLTTVAEPLMLLLVSAIIFTIVVALLQPIFAINTFI